MHFRSINDIRVEHMAAFKFKQISTHFKVNIKKKYSNQITFHNIFPLNQIYPISSKELKLIMLNSAKRHQFPNKIQPWKVMITIGIQ